MTVADDSDDQSAVSPRPCYGFEHNVAQNVFTCQILRGKQAPTQIFALIIINADAALKTQIGIALLL